MTAPPVEDDVAVATTPPQAPESDRVLLGVAGLIADALDVDALWVRIAFVLLGLTGGVGIVLYLGLWLALIGPASIDAAWARSLGGAIVVAGVPLMVATVDAEFTTGPLVVLGLLVALAVVLWQPRVERPERRRIPSRPLPPPISDGATPASPADDEIAAELAALVTGTEPGGADAVQTSAATVQTPRRPRRPRREPSVLGRWTLAMAMIVASAGALIDQLNGGRLHPEQWLGAAVVVCGLGLLVGTVRGHARWLILPALLLAVAGYGAGVLARVGIGVGDAFGDRTIGIFDDTPGGEISTGIGAGQVWIGIDGIPDGVVTVDARVGFGNIDINANADVAVEVRSEIDRGDAHLYGQTQDGDVMRLGPEREPDVIVLARVGVGQVNLTGYQMADAVPEGQTPLLGGGHVDPLVEAHGSGTQVFDGIGVTPDGWIVLAYGEALIDPNDVVVVGDIDPRTGVVMTRMGPFVVDDGTISAPDGTMVGLDDLRQEFATAISPVTTVPAAPALTPTTTSTIPPPSTTIAGQTNTNTNTTSTIVGG